MRKMKELNKSVIRNISDCIKVKRIIVSLILLSFFVLSPTVSGANSISGYKWIDTNANRMKDAGEPGMAGFTIYVDCDNDGQLDATEPQDDRDASGYYIIPNIPSGCWVQKYCEDPEGNGLIDIIRHILYRGIEKLLLVGNGIQVIIRSLLRQILL